MPLFTPPSGLGVGQSYVSVTRASGTTYYNTSSKPKLIIAKQTAAGANNGSLQIQVDGVLVSHHDMYVAGVGQVNTCCVIVPPGSSYVITNVGHTINNTFELG